MEKLSHNLHMKLQEMCDCYMDSDFLAELKREIPVESTTLEEEALRYFALLILYTVTTKAQQLKVKRKKEELKVTVTSLHEKKTLTPPPEEIVNKIFEIIRAITHIETDNGEMPLALGLRREQMELQVKVKKAEDEETMKLLFPEL